MDCNIINNTVSVFRSICKAQLEDRRIKKKLRFESKFFDPAPESIINNLYNNFIRFSYWTVRECKFRIENY